MSGGDALLASARKRLKQAGIEPAGLEARHLLAHVLGRPLNTVAGSAHPVLTGKQRHGFEELLARRIKREPLQRLLGRWEFWSLDLEMGEAGLIPRPDSETLIEAVLDFWPERDLPLRVLDLGTGTGCLLLALLSAYPQATGLGIDISPEAVALARRNAQNLGLAGRALFQEGNWGAGIEERFDLVLSNPPYIPTADIAGLEPEVAFFEPLLALDGGQDGLVAYRQIAADLSRLLQPSGLAVLELGIGQDQPVSHLLQGQGLVVHSFKADLGGIPRAILVKKEDKGKKTVGNRPA
ncbi:MAG: peptide chain release factor N(5)-glutamine methyltransferase [Alphaproteobacteria bacterium]|nr:peptide chain release factor N(5)-glutamine methyltransferase [Alphaproteobacteria bacterium]